MGTFCILLIEKANYRSFLSLIVSVLLLVISAICELAIPLDAGWPAAITGTNTLREIGWFSYILSMLLLIVALLRRG